MLHCRQSKNERPHRTMTVPGSDTWTPNRSTTARPHLLLIPRTDPVSPASGASNKLNYVTDRTNDTTSLLGDFKEYNTGTAPDYSYDGNGNLTADNNNRIANIHYNDRNMPDSGSFTANV